MNFEKRLRALEAKMIRDPVILHLAGGSTRVLYGGCEFLVRLLQGVCGRAKFSPRQTAELALIRQSVGSKESGGGRMVELIQCLLHAQADALQNV
jgi:hypothetical protein